MKAILREPLLHFLVIGAALSFPVPAAQVDGSGLEAAISGLTLGSKQLSFVYARKGP